MKFEKLYYLSKNIFALIFILTFVLSNNSYSSSLYQTTQVIKGKSKVWSDSKIINEDVIIRSGSKLIIENTTIEFGEKGRIIVQENAVLEVNNSQLTGLTSDSVMWQGIEVWGNSKSKTSNPGRVIFTGEVIIKDAHIAILSGKRQVLTSENKNPFDESKSGGLITNKGKLTIQNCGIGIRFTPELVKYPDETLKKELKNINIFCSGNLRDSCYSTSTNNPYPNPQNPWAGYANQYQRTDVGIYINGIKGLDISHCTFNDMQYGILSYDSKFNVQDNSHFTNMIYGIKLENTYNSIINSHEISQCFFDNIPGYLNVETGPAVESNTAAIYIKGGYNDYIHNNRFGDFLTNQKHNHFGIETFKSSVFEITENEFRNFNCGVVTKSSGINGGFIGAENNSISSWDGNRFTNSRRSITTEGSNPKLRLKCNTSDNNYQDANAYDVNYLNTGTLANQGSPSPMGVSYQKQRFPAGNEFFPETINDDFKTISSYNTYTYYRHSGPPEVIPVIAPNSQAYININSTNAAFRETRQAACPDPFWGHIVIGGIQLPQLDISPTSNNIMSYPFSIVDSLQNVKDSLNLVRDGLILTLDDGKTEELLNDIYGNISQGRLKNKLISCSPLSDTVLFALMSEYPLSHGNFKNVMLLNLPVNQDLEYLLYTVLTQIPSGISKQLIEMQAYNPFANTPGKLEQEIEYMELEKQLLLNRFIRLLTDTTHNRYDDAIRLLEAEQNVAADKILTGTYISQNDYISATDKISLLPDGIKEDQDFKALNGLILSYLEQGKTLYELDNTELEFLWQLAYECPLSLAGANAQSILSLLYRAEFEDCPPPIGTRSAKIYDAHLNAPENPEEFSLGDNYPDPADNYTIIPYRLEEEDGILVISNASGKEIFSTKLNFHEHEFFFNTENFVPGIYNYTIIFVDGRSLTKKFAVYR